MDTVKIDPEVFLQTPEPSYLVSAETLLQMNVEDTPQLVDPIFPQSGVMCLAGSSDTGKSALLRQLAIQVSAGDDSFIGFPLNIRFRRVIFVATEDLKNDTAKLLKRQAAQYTAEQLAGLQFMFEVDDVLDKLDETLSHTPADLVLVDTFLDVYGQDLKDTQRIRAFLHPYFELSQKHDCLIIFLHHTGKRTQNYAPSKDNLLSGQGLEAKMRLVVELRADLNDPSRRHFCIVKANYLPSSYKRESYVLQWHEDTFLFTNTGERTPFEMLARQADDDSGKAKYELAAQMKASGLTHDQIAKQVGFASKGSVTKLLDRGKRLGWNTDSVSNVSTGNDEETSF